MLRILMPMFATQQIAIVITSPLNRCLQTAKILTEGLEHIQVIVQPLLTARVSSAWSIGSSIQQKISDYPKFNFDFAHKQQKNWYLDLLDEKIKSKYDKKDYSTESILQFISEGYSQLQESIQNRVRKLKDKIKKIYLQKSENKRILILSHSSILQAIMASEINIKGRAISPIQFNHSFPIYISYDYFMNRTILGSQQKKNLKTQLNENQIQK